MFYTVLLLTCLSALNSVLAHPFHHHALPRKLGKRASDFDVLVEGNTRFKTNIASSNSGLLATLANDGQTPPFMLIGCSDSRVSEGTIFNADPGTIFTQRNIANQFRSSDTNAYSVVSYAISVLGVRHIIVLGHYGCGGVAAAIASPPLSPVSAADAVVQAWIGPLRELFASSSRPEIVELREKLQNQTVIEEPDLREPGFRALVEENVKAGVQRIARTSAVKNHYSLLESAKTTESERRAEGAKEPVDVFVHGLVYDIEDGSIRNLGVSVGPPGKEIPEIPFGTLETSQANVDPVENASAHEGQGESEVKERCGQICEAKLKLRGLYRR